MDRETITKKARDLEYQIQALSQTRLRCLRSDPDYASYIDRLGAGMHRLPIQTFWMLADRMKAIEQGEPGGIDEAAIYWGKHKAEYRSLCRELAL